MNITNFVGDFQGNRTAIVGDVTLTIEGDNPSAIALEQDGVHNIPDIILMYQPAQIRGVIARLQDFLSTLEDSNGEE